jgi:hypothetical protein
MTNEKTIERIVGVNRLASFTLIVDWAQAKMLANRMNLQVSVFQVPVE